MASILIDSNVYLTFYCTAGTKKLADALLEMREHVFVSAQIVNEVQRNQVEVAARYLAEQLQRVEAYAPAIPEDLVPDALLQEVRKSCKELERQKDTIRQAMEDSLCDISASRDAVSLKLAKLWEGAQPPSADDIEKARLRREKGMPPGKGDDPLGDQIVWEQFLGQLLRGHLGFGSFQMTSTTRPNSGRIALSMPRFAMNWRRL